MIIEKISQLSEKRQMYVEAHEDSWDEEVGDYREKMSDEVDDLAGEIEELLLDNFDELPFDFILVELTKLGYAPSLIYDDNGHFAVSSDGFQELASGDKSEDLSIHIYVEEKQWQKTPKEALRHFLFVDAALEEEPEDASEE